MLNAEPVVPAGQETLTASWQALATLSSGARLERRAGAIAAVFPNWAPLNNAILLDAPSSGAAAAAVADLRGLYRDASVDSWALWLPSRRTDFAGPDTVHAIDGMVRDTTTLVMTVALGHPVRSDDRVVRTSVAAATRATDEPVPAGDLPGPDAGAAIDAWALVDDGIAVAAAWSHLRGTDCGLYAVGTVPQWRRRGLARALTQHVLSDAWNRGARTATLQSTPMGEPLYRSLGFSAVGRYEEWVAGE
jgi:GNAT superfamily N-acetyltransferase